MLYDQLGATLLIFGALVIALALLMGVFMYFMRQTIIVVSRLIEYDLRRDVYGHYQRLSRAFYRRNKTGDLMSRVSEDVNNVRMYLGPAVLYGVNLVSTFVFALVAMLAVNVELTLWSLAPLPILSISIYYVSDLINKRSTVIQQQVAKLTSTSQEVYSGIRVVKSYTQERSLAKVFAEQTEDYRVKSMRLAVVDAAFYPIMIFLIGASTIITVYVGGLQVMRGEISPGNVAEFVIYVNMLTWPVTAVGWIASIVQRAEASQARINEFLSEKPEIVSTAPTQHGRLRGEIAFDGVDFTYPGGAHALKGVSFHIDGGQKLAVIGKTGSGKSTIAELLLRNFDPDRGAVELDGADVRERDLEHLRQRIGYVPQEVFLFSDTVAENIGFGCGPDDKPTLDTTSSDTPATPPCTGDIMELPDRYETMVGERGVTLSGGQKQRVSLARALIKNPDIVILDDALSAVDTATEARILGYLNNELADRTAVVITHRILRTAGLRQDYRAGRRSRRGGGHPRRTPRGRRLLRRAI